MYEPPGTLPFELIAIGGAVLFLWALFGRHRLDRPACRACRGTLASVTGPLPFDCPTCGVRIDRDRRIRWRGRAIEWRLAIVGGVAVLAGLGLRDAQQRMWVREVNWSDLLPPWDEVKQVREHGVAAPDAAWYELARRADNGTLPVSAATTAIDRLEAGHDLAKPLDRAPRRFAAAWRHASRSATERRRIDRLMLATPKVNFEEVPADALGERRVQMSLVIASDRSGGPGDLGVLIRVRGVRVDGKPINDFELAGQDHRHLGPDLFGAWTQSEHNSVGVVVAPVPEGDRVVELDLDYAAVDREIVLLAQVRSPEATRRRTLDSWVEPSEIQSITVSWALPTGSAAR